MKVKQAVQTDNQNHDKIPKKYGGKNNEENFHFLSCERSLLENSSGNAVLNSRRILWN